MIEYIDCLNQLGEYTNKTVSREECHKSGIFHKAVVVFIINSKNQVLLQQRSNNKKLWPNLWDITAGGHVLTGEFGIDAAIRETKEEIGIDISKKDLTFIGATLSNQEKQNIIDNHINEYYIAHIDLNIDDIILDKEEVQAIKWINKDELIKKINNNLEDLTGKTGCWKYLLKYFEFENNR